jgi:hypothetical protein
VILLPNTTSKLQVVTASTGTAEIYACYIDASSTTLVPSGGGVGQIEPTTATTTDLVGAPCCEHAPQYQNHQHPELARFELEHVQRTGRG